MPLWQSIFGASCSTGMARKCASNRTQTTAQTYKLWHLSVTLSVYATSLFFPLYFNHSLHAPSLFCTLRNCDVRCTTLSTEEWWAHIATCHFFKTLMQFSKTTLSSCSPWRQSVHHLRNSYPDPYSYSHHCLVKLSSLFNCPQDISRFSFLFPFPCHPQNFTISSWLMRLCGRVALGGPGLERLPLATNSCNSGRKPGFDLQREIIEGIFIHDQSLIQKVLGNLDRKNEKRGRSTVRKGEYV